MPRYLFASMILSLVFSGFLFIYSAVSQPIKQYNLDKGVAIQGYDPVAYFTQNKAIEGTDEFKSEFQGVTYYFANQKDKNLFDADPDKYMPQYGGWCAYAMGNDGTKVKIDPETFKILDGKLYLFYNFFFNNTLTKWNENEKNLKMKADKNWSKFINP